MPWPVTPSPILGPLQQPDQTVSRAQVTFVARLAAAGITDAARLAGRSGSRPIIAVAGRSLLPQERWSEMDLTGVYTLADYTDQDSSKDPELSAALLRRIGKDIGTSLL